MIARRFGISIAVALAFALVRAVCGTAADDGPFARGVYVGTIGTSPIVVEFGLPSSVAGGVAARYFYRRVGVGIALDRSSGGGTFVARPLEGAQGVRRAGEAWALRIERGRLLGTWRSASGERTLPIFLRRIAGIGATPVDDDSGDSAAYVAELLRTNAFVGAPRTLGGIAYRPVGDSRYVVGSVELGDGPPPGIVPAERANRALRAAFDRDRVAAYRCATFNGWYGRGDAYRVRARLGYASAVALTLERRGEAACGGAHPDYVVDPLTLDLRRGTVVDWSSAIADPAGLARTYRRLALSLGRDPFLHACFKADVFADAIGFRYGLRSNGLDVYPTYPHVEAWCAVDVVIPTAQARRLLTAPVAALLP